MNYFQYMETKTRKRGTPPVVRTPEQLDLVEFMDSPEVAGAYYSNSGIEVRPATEEEIHQLYAQITFATRTPWA